MKCNILVIFMSVMFSVLMAPVLADTILYVDDDAPLGGDGQSWETAYRFLQDGLSVAAAMVEQEEPDPDTGTGGQGSRSLMNVKSVVDPCSVEIRVAQGVYRPDCNEAFPEGSGVRDASFELVSGMVFKGGYAGLTGADPNVYDPALYRTVLSGDLAGDDLLVADPCDFVAQEGEGRWNRPQQWCLLIESTRRENCWHVVTARGDNQGVALTGVIITGGNAYQLPFAKGDAVSYDDEEVGGAIFNQALSLTLRDCILAHNSGHGHGGAMFNVEDCNLVMEDCRLVENYAYAIGGAMNCDEGGAILLIRCRFDRNVVGYGPCTTISSQASTMELRNCTFVGNTDQDRGEPVLRCSGGSLDLDHCVFKDNLGPGVSCSQAEAIFKDCLFQNNTSGTGRALRLSWSDASIMNCSFINNHSDVGGAILIYSSDVSNFVSIRNSLFCGNYAYDGGAIKIGGTMTAIENCTFSDNRSDRKGGALFSTVSAELTVVNSIFEGNAAPSGMNAYIGQSYLGTLPSFMSAEYCLIEGGQDSIALDSQCTLTWGEGNFDADPCFVDPGYWDANGTVSDANDDYFVNGDYHLKSQAGHWDSNGESWICDMVTSPCIDAGDPNSPIMFEPFPNGGVINMGSYGGTAEASKSYFGEPVCETIVAGDINGDGRVDFEDLAILMRHWTDGEY